jgi:hypothetical protein
MIIFLYGPDSYRRLSKEREVVDVYQKKHGTLSSARFNFGDVDDLNKFREFLINNSMFEPNKLAIVEDPFNAPVAELYDLFKPYLENKSKTTILISSDDKPPAKLAFLIKKPSRYQEFSILEGKPLKIFINKEAVNRGIKLKPEILEGLANAYGGNTWFIVTELDKLALMSEQKVDTRLAPNYYELINNLKYGRSPRTKLVALEFILSDRRDEPRRVFNSLAYRLRDAKEAVMLADYDIAVKSGKLDYEEILLDLALT